MARRNRKSNRAPVPPIPAAKPPAEPATPTPATTPTAGQPTEHAASLEQTPRVDARADTTHAETSAAQDKELRTAAPATAAPAADAPAADAPDHGMQHPAGAIEESEPRIAPPATPARAADADDNRTQVPVSAIDSTEPLTPEPETPPPAAEPDKAPRATMAGTEEKRMQDATRAQEAFNQAAGKGLEAATMWAETNQRVLRDLVEFSAGTATESIRLYSELQQSAIDAFRDAQANALRWQSSWQDGPKDPMQWYQKALSDSVGGAQKWFHFVEGNAQAVTRSAERLHASAEQAGKGIQQTFTEFVGKTKELYARS